MAEVELTIAGRPYRVACRNGEEENLRAAGALVDAKSREALSGLGTLSEFQGTLRAQTAAGCPALIGVLRPKVVLPDDFETRYTAQEQSLILAHENVDTAPTEAHRRQDAFVAAHEDAIGQNHWRCVHAVCVDVVLKLVAQVRR